MHYPQQTPHDYHTTLGLILSYSPNMGHWITTVQRIKNDQREKSILFQQELNEHVQLAMFVFYSSHAGSIQFTPVTFHEISVVLIGIPNSLHASHPFITRYGTYFLTGVKWFSEHGPNLNCFWRSFYILLHKHVPIQKMSFWATLTQTLNVLVCLLDITWLDLDTWGCKVGNTIHSESGVGIIFF